MNRRAILKRGFDLLFSGIGLVLLTPLGVVIAIAIKLGDGGSVFFRQKRVGRGGRIFGMWKFRTMIADATARGPGITAKGDPRITPVGRWLRQFKLDELPQLLNVIRGEMSLVGPRPEMPHYVVLYTTEQRRVLDYAPGITDLATLEFRDEETLLARCANPESYYLEHCIPRKIELNLLHQSRASLWADTMIILRTLFPALDRRLHGRDAPNARRGPGALVLAVGMLVLHAAVGWQFMGGVSSDRVAAPIDLRALLPPPPADWSQRDEPLGPTEAVVAETKEVLDFDGYVYRTYTRANQSFSLYLAYWRRSEGATPLVASHLPDRCWSSSGMDCVEIRNGTQLGASGLLPRLEFRRFTVPGGSEVQVVYWLWFGGELFDFGRGLLGRYDGREGYRFLNLGTRLKRLWADARHGSRAHVFVRLSSPGSLEMLAARPEVADFFRKVFDLGRIETVPGWQPTGAAPGLAQRTLSST